jgi:hypothetical protein
MRYSTDNLEEVCQVSFATSSSGRSTCLSVTFPSDVTNCQAAEDARIYKNSGQRHA